MPITRNQFVLGINADIEAWMEKIYDFLTEHKDEAFTTHELADGLGVILDPAAALKGTSVTAASFAEYKKAEKALELFRTALEKLVEKDAVEKREIANIEYYAKGRRTLEDIVSTPELPF